MLLPAREREQHIHHSSAVGVWMHVALGTQRWSCGRELARVAIRYQLGAGFRLLRGHLFLAEYSCALTS